MARTISDLIAAAFEDKSSLTPADWKRLARYIPRGRRIDATLMRNVSPDDLERSKTMTAAEGFAEYRKTLLRNLRSYTIEELRGHVRQLLVLLGMYVEMSAAREGKTRRRRREGQRGQEQTAQSKRDDRESLRRTIDAIRNQHQPPLSRPAAARIHLRDTEPAWDGLSTEKQKQRIEALLRRLRGRKKRPDTR